jgi:AraC-like DNA-binding protein
MKFRAGPNVLPVLPDPDTARSPVVGLVWDENRARHIGRHRHQRGQIISVIKGIITVSTRAGTWVIPPNRAVWIPPNMEHWATYSRVCALRTLYTDVNMSTNFPTSRCVELYLDSLSRELLNTAVHFDWDLDPDHSDMRLAQLLIERMPLLEQPVLRVPEGKDPRVIRVMQLLRDAPDADRTLAQSSKQAGATGRTMARLFMRDAGMSFSEWRRQYRLMLALEQLADGAPVTTVAHNLGYDSASNFSTMFRSFFHQPPGEFFRSHRPTRR